ncbi:MAG: histidine phosphatase family protein [Alphaproteobacteria bacterium]
MTATVTRWWWVRHALVTANEGRIYGRSDLPCETDDTEMFEGLAEILPSDAVLVTSDLMRTHQTADAIKAAGLEMAPRIEIPDLAEQSFGDWQGQHFADIQKEMPVKLHDFWMCPAHYRPPGGESFVDLIARVAPQIERISEEYPGRHIIAVTHGGTIRAALAIALGLDPERALSFTIENLSVTRIDRIETGSDDPTPGAGQLNWRTVLVNRMAGNRKPGWKPIR